MKTKLAAGLLVAAVTFVQLGHAQQELESGTGGKKSSSLQQKEGEKVVIPSQHSSVVVMMSENGLEIFSPTARPELGIGEKVLSKPAEHDRKIDSGAFLE